MQHIIETTLLELMKGQQMTSIMLKFWQWCEYFEIGMWKSLKFRSSTCISPITGPHNENWQKYVTDNWQKYVTAAMPRKATINQVTFDFFSVSD